VDDIFKPRSDPAEPRQSLGRGCQKSIGCARQLFPRVNTAPSSGLKTIHRFLLAGVVRNTCEGRLRFESVGQKNGSSQILSLATNTVTECDTLTIVNDRQRSSTLNAQTKPHKKSNQIVSKRGGPARRSSREGVQEVRGASLISF